MWKIEHRAYRLPFRAVVRTAHGPWAEREGVLIRIARIDDSGRELGRPGWGECAPIPWFGSETVEAATTALRDLRGQTRNFDEALAQVPTECPALRAALAAAWADAPNHTETENLAKETPADTAIASNSAAEVKFLSLAALLPSGRAALPLIETRAEAGFRTFKWKVGVQAAADELSILDDLIGELPAGARLRLDANGAWDRRTAERWLGAAADRPMIEYVEQPVSTEARAGEDLLRGLAEDFPVALALDEAVNAARDVERWLAADWRGVWVLKPSLLGEPEAILPKLAKVRADVVFGSALETAVGARAGLRLAFAWAAREGRPAAERRALGYGVWPLFQEARADAPFVTPFVRREDVERLNPEALWNALV